MPPYVGLHRKIVRWRFHKDSNTVSTLVHLLAISAEEPRVQNGLEIQVGQIVSTKVELAELIGLSYKQLRTCMERLEECGIITVETNHHATIVTILQSDLYALVKKSREEEANAQEQASFFEDGANQRANRRANQRANKKSPQSVENKRFDDVCTLDEGKPQGKPKGKQQGKQNKGENYSKPPAYTPEFERFWEQYPRKSNKRDAFKAWGQVEPTKETQEKILHNIATRRGRGDWIDPQYIPYPGTYLRGWMWEDEPVPRTHARKPNGYYNPFAEQLMMEKDNAAKGNDESACLSAGDVPDIFEWT